ncbi:ribulose-phosphate 3-epimerase [Candidatus Woesearchaeota archaeon]|nr:ribulose-phosphate 3-epimerase [Candidatus Woesearchaeota archaeon]|tara:strand:+ start:1970 stop:2623 length:654 start_codon:yes stop_codon:yes gene_type:complete
MPSIKIVPSILSANQEKINEEIKEVEDYSDLLQVDVMDNKFVPNITPGPEYLEKLDTKVPLDIHLMVLEPSEEYVRKFIDANPKLKINNITVHVEACADVGKTLDEIRNLGVKPCIALNPKTDLEKILPYVDKVGMVLFMTVEPGFSGQKFIADVMPKIGELREMKPELDIQVDGGVNLETAPIAVKAGANVLVASSYVFKSEDKVKAIKDLMEAVQ